MTKYKFDLKAFLGYRHFGGAVYSESAGVVELSDEEVKKLVALIRESGFKTDVDEIDLSEKLPEIYEKLEEAYTDAFYCSIDKEAFWDAYDEDQLIGASSLMELCEKKYGFDFDAMINNENFRDKYLRCGESYLKKDGTPLKRYYKTVKKDFFSRWFNDFMKGLTKDEFDSFIDDNFYEINLSHGEWYDYQYTIEIPKEIVKMAKSK